MNGSAGSRIRRWTMAGVGVALMVLIPGPAFANSEPGTHFPEQPGSHLEQGCESILYNPDRALNFITGEQHMSEQAEAIVVATYVDACLGG